MKPAPHSSGRGTSLVLASGAQPQGEGAMSDYLEFYRNKVVLVTGGAGAR